MTGWNSRPFCDSHEISLTYPHFTIKSTFVNFSRTDDFCMTLVCPGFTKLVSFLTASHAEMTAEVTHQKVNREDAEVLTERVLYLLFQLLFYFFSLFFTSSFIWMSFSWTFFFSEGSFLFFFRTILLRYKIFLNHAFQVLSCCISKLRVTWKSHAQCPAA